MKKTLLATLLAIALVVSCFAGMSLTSASAATDYVIFADGAFQNGGEILDGCGTVIKDGCLVGGEAMSDGAAGTGWFQIKIDGSGNADAFKMFKYLVIDCEPVIENGSTGMYNGGTVQFGAGNTYNFTELGGEKGATIAVRKTYTLDISGCTFEDNWFLMSHCAIGYKVYSLTLTNDPSNVGTGGNGGSTGGNTSTPSGYVIFADGAFQNGGEILDGCGTVIKDGCLVGGEAMSDGAAGTGWFQIKIDGSGNADAFKMFKYLVIDCEPVIENGSTGMYNGGTVQFGAGNTYNFTELGAQKGATIAVRDTYVLDISGCTFEDNWLLLSHCAIGYKVYAMWLTDDATVTPPSGGNDSTTAAPADNTTAAPADDTTAAPADDTTAAPADDTTAAPADDTTAAPQGTTPAPVATTAAPAGQNPTNAPVATTAAPAGQNPTNAPVQTQTQVVVVGGGNTNTSNPSTGANGIAGAAAMAVLALAGFAVVSKKSK